MQREFFYLFRLVGKPGLYRLGITDDVAREEQEAGLGLDPACPCRPKGRASEARLMASCWVGAAAPAVRMDLWRRLGRPQHWGNAQLGLSDEQLQMVLEAMEVAAYEAIRVPDGFITGQPGWGWEEALNAGLEDAVRQTFNRRSAAA